MRNILIALVALVGFAFGANSPMPPYMAPAGGSSSSGGSGSFDSLRVSGLSEGLVYQPGQPSNLVSIPNGPVGQILTSRGPGLYPEWENPAAIQAFTTGSDLVSNPTLTNPDARFLQVTAQPGMYGYVNGSFATTNNMRGIAYNGSSIYVAVGFGGTIFTSTTGTDSWTARTSGTANDIYGVIWDGTRFLAVGAAGTMLNSVDGITWSSFAVGVNQFNNICKNNGALYVAVGNNGGTYYTTSNPTVGANWTLAASGIASDNYAGCVSRTDTIWIAGASGIVKSSSNGSAWNTRADIGTQMLTTLIYDGTRFVASGAGGTVLTSTTGTSWAQSTTGTTRSLRVFSGSSRVFALGDSGISLESSDHGVTWTAGKPVGTNRFIRFGINDPRTNSWALVVGDSGAFVVGNYPFRSAAYETNADRAANIDTLGYADYPYSETPLVVIIPGQITFNIGIARFADMPFNFDVVTISDIIYNLFVVQNSSLSPGPYYGYNAVYDFGPDMRFEYGLESNNEWATLLIQDSPTGDWFIKKSNAPGNAGDPITWVDAFIIRGNGRVDIPNLNVTGADAAGAGTMTLGTAAPCATGTVIWIPIRHEGVAGYIPWCAAP